MIDHTLASLLFAVVFPCVVYAVSFTIAQHLDDYLHPKTKANDDLLRDIAMIESRRPFVAAMLRIWCKTACTIALGGRVDEKIVTLALGDLRSRDAGVSEILNSRPMGMLTRLTDGSIGYVDSFKRYYANLSKGGENAYTSYTDYARATIEQPEIDETTTPKFINDTDIPTKPPCGNPFGFDDSDNCIVLCGKAPSGIRTRNLSSLCEAFASGAYATGASNATTNHATSNVSGASNVCGISNATSPSHVSGAFDFATTSNAGKAPNDVENSPQWTNDQSNAATRRRKVMDEVNSRFTEWMTQRMAESEAYGESSNLDDEVRKTQEATLGMRSASPAPFQIPVMCNQTGQKTTNQTLDSAAKASPKAAVDSTGTASSGAPANTAPAGTTNTAQLSNEEVQKLLSRNPLFALVTTNINLANAMANDKSFEADEAGEPLYQHPALSNRCPKHIRDLWDQKQAIVDQLRFEE